MISEQHVRIICQTIAVGFAAAGAILAGCESKDDAVNIRDEERMKAEARSIDDMMSARTQCCIAVDLTIDRVIPGEDVMVNRLSVSAVDKTVTITRWVMLSREHDQAEWHLVREASTDSDFQRDFGKMQRRLGAGQSVVREYGSSSISLIGRQIKWVVFGATESGDEVYGTAMLDLDQLGSQILKQHRDVGTEVGEASR